MSKVCGCGRGYGSEVDGLCSKCRENQYSRADAKAVGVRHCGDGMSLDQEVKLLAKKWRVPAWKGDPK